MKKMTLLLVGLLLLTVPPMADAVRARRKPPASAQRPILNQKVVRVRDTKAKDRVKQLIPPTYEFLIEGGKFLVIRAKEGTPVEEWESSLKELKANKDVLSIESDYEAIPMEHDEGKPDPAAKGKPGAVAAVGEAAKCHLTPHCGKHNPSWARLQVGADLGDKIVAAVATKSKTPAYAKVAVVDTGFDVKGHTDSLDSQGFKTAKGHGRAGAADTDVDGHGTGVVGMIAGKEIGVTSQVEVTSYRHTENNSAGKGSTALIAAAVEKACEEHDVVNLSWGTLADELGAKEEEELWYEKAKEKGCLVIQAAGNSGIKSKETEYSMLSPVLKVGATDEFSADSPFSTAAVVYGPGAGVYTLVSSASDDAANETEQAPLCPIGKGKMGPANGTSFAGPLVAGVAGQVITILKSKGVLPKEPRKKLALVKSILKASADWSKEAGNRRPVVNSLLASLIANEVTSEPTFNVEALIKLGRDSEPNRKACERPLENCTIEKECGKKKTCVNELRYHFTACLPAPKDVKPQKDLHEWLFTSLQQLGERELTLQLMERVPKKGPLAKEVAAELDRQWKELKPDGETVIWGSEPRALNLLYSAQRAGLSGPFKTVDKIRDLLRGSAVSDFIQFTRPLGASAKQSGAEANARQVLELFKGLSADEQLKFIGEIPWVPELKKGAGGIKEFGSFEGQSPLHFLYFMQAKKDELDKPVRDRLEKRIKELAEMWFSGELAKQYALAMTLPPMLQDAFFQSLPDGLKRMDARLNLPLSDKNEDYPFYQFALDGTVLTTDQKKTRVAQWLKDPAFRTSEMMYLHDEAMAWALAKADKDFVTEKVVPALLDNPHAKLPQGMVPSGPVRSENQTVAATDDFYPKFVKVNLERGIKRLADPKADLATRDLAVKNIIAAMKQNSLFKSADQKAFYKDGAQKEFESFLSSAAEHAVKSKGFGFAHTFGQPGNVIGGSETVSAVLEEVATFEEAGLTESLISTLKPVKDDMLKNPAKYPATMKQQLKKLYGLTE